MGFFKGLNPKIVILLVILVPTIVIGGYFLFLDEDTRIISYSKMTAEEIVNELKKEVSEIGAILVYNEETDRNNLLGRPEQYTSKVTFEDKRLEQNTDNEFMDEEARKEPVGGTIEVFENKQDMQKRKEYVESISSSMSMLSQYIYSKGNALLRIESDLTPSQAKVYEEAFYKIVK